MKSFFRTGPVTVATDENYRRKLLWKTNWRIERIIFEKYVKFYKTILRTGGAMWIMLVHIIASHNRLSSAPEAGGGRGHC